MRLTDDQVVDNSLRWYSFQKGFQKIAPEVSSPEKEEQRPACEEDPQPYPPGKRLIIVDSFQNFFFCVIAMFFRFCCVE